ncbi:MAG: hypothetical protein U0Q16_09625 [Bryobacteraceae bacterium]
MPTRTELEAQLRTVEAQIADTQRRLDDAPDIATRAALSARLSMLEARADSLRQAILLTPAEIGATRGAPATRTAARSAEPAEEAPPRKAAAKKSAAKSKRAPGRR